MGWRARCHQGVGSRIRTQPRARHSHYRGRLYWSGSRCSCYRSTSNSGIDVRRLLRRLLGYDLRPGRQASLYVWWEGKLSTVHPRTLSPLDEETILNSVARTHRLVIVDEDNPRCSAATDIAALVADKAFTELDAPIKRVTAPHTPVPFSPPLEQFYIPSPERIVATIQEIM